MALGSGAAAMPFTIAHFLLPDMDYWGQKSISQNQTTYGATETKFYSVLTDNDRDGNADVQVAFKQSKTVVYTEIENRETAIIAAKPQDPWSFLCNYVVDSWNAIWGNARKEDSVFHSKLTEDRLDNNNYSSLYTPEIASAIDASYRKFTKITTKSYVEEEIEEQITVSEWEEGEFVETRIYLDAFESDYFDSSELMTITDLDSGQEIELPISYSPSLLNNSREGWALDGVPEKFDQVLIVSPDQEVEVINIHQETITINIPTRFSPYHDHRKISQEDAVQDTNFEVTGVLIVPADGQVYYTSDKDAFKSGNAKTQGLYFYFDSDLDNFYETVYVLAPDYDSDGVYDVMTIGYNSDNKHNFAPYEKVDVNEPIINRDDYERHLSTETVQYGDNWVYNYAKLEEVETLFPKDTYDGFEPKDDLFEVWKLVKESDKNSKFSQLFYEVRHKEYDKTWTEYSEHFWRDVGDQVFATLIASSISFAIIAISVGTGTPLAHVAYFVAYSAISKFQMDMKAKEAEAAQRSSTFYPEGAGISEPTSLNQKYHTDEFWGDSMPAALSGHPGAYYATVMGGEVGAQYTAQAIVSPPNDARFWDSGNFPGVLDYLGHNLATFGSGDPDKFTPLDFDNHNLDFLLVSSELYAYNDEPSYTYLENPALIDLLFDAEPNYERYTPVFGQEPMLEYITGPEYALDQIKLRDSYLFRQNTLGYLTKKVRQASNGSLTTIKATCVDGQPQYVFTTGNDVVPNSALFQPLIVSPERYEELESRNLVDGYIVVDVQASSSSSSQGIDSNELTTEERSLYFGKIPLADVFGGFDYPIKSIEMFGISDDQVVDSRSLTTSEYNVSLGNLYFTRELKELIPFFANKIPIYSQECYYKFVIKVAKIVPDDGSENANRNALSIATTYAVMDYFDQYTYAQTSAQMIAEVGYTEIMTITSTAISAPFVALGAYAAKVSQEASATATKIVVKATSKTTQQATIFALDTLIFEIVKRAVIGTIAETVEEIVVDGFFETAIQSAVRMAGGSSAAGHWVSTLFTSLRETANFGYLTGSTGVQAQQGFAGQVQNLETYVSNGMALKGETSLARFSTDYEQYITAKMDEIGNIGETLTESKISLGRILATGIFTGLSLLAPSLAGFNLYAISKLVGGIGTRIDAKTQNKFLASRNSMMLLKDAIEIEKQEVDLGKKPINTQPENNLPKNILRVSNLQEGPLNVENNFFGAKGAISTGIVALDPTDKYAAMDKEQEIAESQRIKAHLAKVAEIDKGYNAEGEFAGIISKLEESGKFKKSQLTRIQKALEKLKGKYYDEKTILDSSTEGLYGAINLHVMKAVEEKIINQELLSPVERDIFNAKILLLNIKTMSSGRYPAQYLRREWDGLSPSPYYPALKGFADNLADILSYYKVAKTDSEIDSILGFDPKHSLNEMVSVLSGYTLKGTKLKSFSFQIDEKTLDRWFVRLEEEISLDSKFKLRDKRLIMRDLKDLFDATYKKFGYEAYHPLYRSVRLMLARVGEVLVDAGAIEKNTFSNLEELTGLNLINLYNYLLTNPRCNPDIDPTLALKGKAIEKAIEKTKKGNAEFTSEHEKQIEEIIGNHIVQLLDFRKGRKLLESYRPSYRLDLLRNIVDRCSILQKVRYKYELANLLLGDFDFSTNFLKPHKDMDQSKPHLEEVFQIIINSFRWSKKTFSDLGISVTDSELRIFKFIINKEVKKWVFNVENLETSWVRYISKLKPERVIGAPTSMKMDYDLVFALFQASLIHEDNPKLTFSDMAANKFFDRSKNLIANLRRGIGFSPEAVRKMLITTIAWIKTEAAKDPNSYKLKYYFSLQAHIQFYAMKHHMSLMKPKGGGSTRFFNGRRFGYDYIVAYHVVEGIGKHLGIDPLFFSAIKDESFHMTKTLRNKLKDLGEKVLVFIRHHFRDDPVGRDSFLAKDNLITDASKHVSWESLDERDSLIVLEGYEKLIRMKGTGQRMPGTSGINEITRKDIEQVFRGEEWVYARWYSDRDFTSNLKEFNNKRRDIRSMTLDKFIKTYNPIAYARFYENILKDKRPQLQLFLSELHPTLDISSVIAAGTDSIYLKEITRAFSWLLRQDNYPIKI